jgi:PEGA domain
MEFVTVHFVDDRQVLIDGQPSGRTNQTLQVQAGTHTISLGTPHDYNPAWRRPTVQNTSILKPLVVSFAKQ